MVRLRLTQILKRRKMTRYALAKATGLTQTQAYRLARPDGAFGRLEAETLDRLCRGLGVQPGDLLEWVPSPSAHR